VQHHERPRKTNSKLHVTLLRSSSRNSNNKFNFKFLGMKIELKHITGYLPYKLLCKAQGEGEKIFNMQGFTNLSYVDLHETGRTVCEQFDIEDVFPILSHLSDLKKDEHFDLYMELCEEMESLSCEYLLEALINKTAYSIGLHRMEILENWMHKNHFDWRYDLIKNGLAIDKNTTL